MKNQGNIDKLTSKQIIFNIMKDKDRGYGEDMQWCNYPADY